ncbi:hypothetical protein Vid5_gp31 [Pantoea phage vB_PagS_Vid5]|uniref:Uncharacterized protein n=1 Tax=Pantoea phage vB_PagS_Vid5 TaxID=2099652 RepID=A0A2P1CKL9_9CAUD|nr:hypothetical protein FDJ45_gp031 [Pantoea phage vB_PagS_Vid5]AVJ51786.1 hypothetical protein Vid5_gp31 [Pantoea phage vB_PagS_Vid5]
MTQVDVLVNGCLEQRPFSHMEEFTSLRLFVAMPQYNANREKPYYSPLKKMVVISPVSKTPLWGNTKNAKRP